jgi:hypothetical protein
MCLWIGLDPSHKDFIEALDVLTKKSCLLESAPGWRSTSFLVVVLPIWVMNLAVSREKNHPMNTFAALSCRLLAGRLRCQRSGIFM